MTSPNPVQADHAIVAQNLTKYFDSANPVVHDVSFAVPKGCVLGFLGRNGSGKTTTLRMLLGLLDPTRGSSSLLGFDSRSLPPAARARIGYMPEGHPVYEWMRPAQAADFQKQFFPHWNQSLFDSILSHFRIAPKTKAAHLSRGQRAGLSLALTLAPEPELLILDDPSLGLDPVARRSLLEALLFFTSKGERTVLFSSHILADIERVADHIAILDHSVLRACCPVDTFRSRVVEFTLTFPGRAPAVPDAQPRGLLRTVIFDFQLRLTFANVSQDTHDFLRSLHPASIQESTPSFEDQVLAYMDDNRLHSLISTTWGS
jgi:ABC-2 type transport system ATP-binding protein